MIWPWGEFRRLREELRLMNSRLETRGQDAIHWKDQYRMATDEIGKLKASLAHYSKPTGDPMPCPGCSSTGLFVNQVPLMSYYRIGEVQFAEGTAPIGQANGVGAICSGCGEAVRITQAGAVLAKPKGVKKERQEPSESTKYTDGLRMPAR